MSFIRRVKSFSVKKYKSDDHLKNEETNLRPTPRTRRKNLVKEKSVSMEYLPITLDLERNDLFIKQKTKMVARNQESEERTPQPIRRNVQNRTELKKRYSVSFDEERFGRVIAEFSEKPVQLRRIDERRSQLRRDRSRYKTIDVVNDLITDFDDGAKDAVVNPNKPGSFPLVEEEEVEIRQTRTKVERPKTYGSTFTKKKEESLIFRGACRFEIDKDVCVEIKTRQTLRLQNGYLQLLDERGNTVATIRNNVLLKKGAKLVGKKDVEMTDYDRKIYRLYFDSGKDAKQFIDNERMYNSAPSSSALKNIGPWTQLRKLLKKRSSRDLLESKGIIKNEPIFGNTLEELCDADNPVPEVITRIVDLIEVPENITSLGLYRASANLAVVQNIRFEINCGRWEILEKHKNDVDVLAGTLKLFFRELKQPLISYEVYEQLQKALANKEEISTIIDNLPRPNRATLLYVVRHLLKVCQHKEKNKMDLHNIAICWGPSLITLPDHCVDLVTQTTQFTKITEDLLSYYSKRTESQDVVKTPDFVYVVVRKLTGFIEANIETEGIYRKSGSNTKIDKIMKQLEKQNLGDLDAAKNDIHELCCVLKKFITSLRHSLVPDEFFHRYYDICDKVEDTFVKNEVRRMVDELPRKDVVLLLFEHLNKVVSHDRKNKMTIGVLSDIWMTTLMSNINVQNYKKKMPKYSKLFLILMNLNDQVLPDLVVDPKMRTWSKYENVPDDIHNEGGTLAEKVSTKL